MNKKYKRILPNGSCASKPPAGGAGGDAVSCKLRCMEPPAGNLLLVLRVVVIVVVQQKHNMPFLNSYKPTQTRARTTTSTSSTTSWKRKRSRDWQLWRGKRSRKGRLSAMTVSLLLKKTSRNTTCHFSAVINLLSPEPESRSHCQIHSWSQECW